MDFWNDHPVLTQAMKLMTRDTGYYLLDDPNIEENEISTNQIEKYEVMLSSLNEEMLMAFATEDEGDEVVKGVILRLNEKHGVEITNDLKTFFDEVYDGRYTDCFFGDGYS